MIKVVVADDHPLTREGVKTALDEKSNIRVVGEAGTGPELEAVLAHMPDVLLLDIRMPEFDAIRQVPEGGAARKLQSLCQFSAKSGVSSSASRKIAAMCSRPSIGEKKGSSPKPPIARVKRSSASSSIA